MATVSLKKISGNSYYCDGIFSIGVYAQGSKAVLIDSGSDTQSARDAHQALQAADLTVTAIINTHCHPDHCGGNNFFQKLYPSINIFASHYDAFFIEDSNAALRCFCSGAAPFAGLQTKHLMLQHSTAVSHAIRPYRDQMITVGEIQLQIITLEGHTPGHIGVITPDNILYSGDALFGPETLKKHPVLFYSDIEKTLSTFIKLAQLPVDACVLYHGGVTTNLPDVVRSHEQLITDIQTQLLAILQIESLSIDMITQKMMQQYAIPDSMIAFTLTQTAMRAHLAYLEKRGAITISVEQGLLQVKRIEEREKHMKSHVSAQSSHYDTSAEKYDAFNDENSRVINQTIETILQRYHVKTVLDLTCGTGSQLLWLAKCGYTMTGSDINAKMLAIAQQKAKAENLAAQLVQGDMRTSVLGTFDSVITIFNAIGHLTKEDFEKALQNIHLNLKNGGLYFFDIFNLDYLLHGNNITKLTIDWQVAEGDTKVRNIQYSTINADGVLASYDVVYRQEGNHELQVARHSQTLQVYSAEQLAQLLNKNGFEVLEICAVDGSHFDTINSDRMVMVARKI